MRHFTALFPRAIHLRRLALAAALAASPCSVLAQSPGGAIGDALETLHLRKSPPPAADFVQKSRPETDQLDYQPMAPTAKPSPNKRTPEQLDALGAELEAARARNAKAAAQVKVPDAATRAKRN